MTRQLAFVKWRDAYGVSASWSEIDDSPIEHHYNYSVGWVVKEDDESIVLVPHVCPAHKAIGSVESGCGDMTIPKCTIVIYEPLTTIGGELPSEVSP